jgi:hypothetical protein
MLGIQELEAVGGEVNGGIVVDGMGMGMVDGMCCC